MINEDKTVETVDAEPTSEEMLSMKTEDLDKLAEGKPEPEKKPSTGAAKPDKTPKLDEKPDDEDELSPEAKSADPVKAKEGILKDLQKTRTKLKEAKASGDATKAELKILQDKLDGLTAEMEAIKKPPVKEEPDEDPLAKLQDDDIVTKKLQLEHDAWVERQKNKEQTVSAQQENEVNKVVQAHEDNFKASIKTAAGTYTEEKAGKGLDFESVRARAIKEFLATDPKLGLNLSPKEIKKRMALQHFVFTSDDPGELLYSLGLTTAESRALIKSQGVTQVVEKISGRPVKTKGGESTSEGVAPEDMPIEKLLEKPSEELEELAKGK